MNLIEIDNLWEIIDKVIDENIADGEEIKSYGGGDGSVQMSYSVVRDHKLLQSHQRLGAETLRKMSVPTLRMFIKEIIGSLRGDAH
jgi:hypothetical protein